MKGCSESTGWPFNFFMKNEKEISKVKHTFKKEERLCSKKVIDKLFTEGQTFLAYPLKIVFLPLELQLNFPVQAGFTVSKKNFKRAVKRNRLKRLMREAYRLNKNELYLHLKGQQIAVFFIYIGKDISTFEAIEKATKKAFQLILKKLEES